MSVLLQISDPHFGTEQAAVVEALLALAHRLRPDLVVLSGDVTQRAHSSQFDRAEAFVERLAAPVLLAIPGNHDVPLFNPFGRMFRPYAGFRRVFGAELEPEHESADLLVLTLKTTRRWRHIDGQISVGQIDRTSRRFAAASPRQLRIAVVHQPVAVRDPDDRADLLHGRHAALRRWAESGCDLVLGGHIHLPFIVDLRERNPALARPIWAVQAGTAVSSRVRAGAPNSVNVIRHDAGSADTCVVEQWDWQSESGAFARVRRTPLALGRGVAAGVDAGTAAA